MMQLALLAHFGHWNSGDGSWVWMALMMALGVIVIALALWGLFRLGGGTAGGTAGILSPHHPEDPFQTARRRYAAGEISKEELREIERTLRGQD